MPLHVGHVRMLRLAGAFRQAGKALSDDGLAAEWQAVDAVKATAEEPIARAFAAILDEQEAAVMARVRGRKAEGDVLREAVLIDLDAWARTIDERVRPFLLSAMEAGFRTGALRINADLAFETTTRSLAVLEDVIGKVQGTTATTRELLADIVQQGLEDGVGVDEIASRISAHFADWKGWRAKLVAQTSVTPTFAVAQQDAFLDGGVTTNRWLSQRDNDVRPEHQDLDGEEVAVGENFSNGLAYPQEPNCRCDVLPVLSEGEKSTNTSFVQRRNAHLRTRYQEEIADRYGERSEIIEELRTGSFEGKPYALAWDTCRKACDGG